MKKIGTFCLIANMLFSMCFVTSCDNKNSEEENGVSNTSYDVVLNDFENFDEDFLTLRVLNNIGKMDINYQSDYVKFGNSSIKIEPLGGLYGTQRPTFVVPTYSSRFAYDYKDFSDVERISVWVYNAETNMQQMGVSLQTGAFKKTSETYNIDRTSATYYNLQSGWNYLEWNLDVAYLRGYKLFNIQEILGIVFDFDYVNPYNGQSPVLYMDDLRLHYDTDRQENEIVLKADSEKGIWEILDFEDERQNLLLGCERSGVRESLKSTNKIINAGYYNTEAPNGNNVLELTMRAGINNSAATTTAISGKVIKQAVKGIGEDIRNNPQNYAFCLDIYYASREVMPIILKVGCSALKDGQSTYQSLIASVGEWTTFKFLISEWDEMLIDRLQKGRTTLLDGFQESDAKFSMHPDTVSIIATGFALDDNTDDRIVLIDNVRIEKIQDTGDNA